MLQGRFKQRLPLDSLHIGSEFARPLDLPASALLTPLLEMFMATLGAGELRLQGQQPHLYLPLARAAQVGAGCTSCAYLPPYPPAPATL